MSAPTPGAPAAGTQAGAPDGPRGLVHRRPRLAAALALAGATGAVTFLTWQPFAELRGAVPAITLGAALAHGVAGALLGRRLVDRAHTPHALHAAVLGAVASLLAVALFTPLFAWWVSHGAAPARGESSFVALTVYLGLMSFFAGGWLLLFVSAAVGWALWLRAEREPDAPAAADAAPPR